MKKNYSFLVITCLLVFFTAKGQVTQTFSFTGSTQTFVVPPCVGFLTLDVKGAEGANALDKLTTNASGGRGGRAQGVLTVTPGSTLYINVGGMGNTNGNGGFNGGGNGGLSSAGSSCFGGNAGGGGGASDIRVNGIALSNRVVVAGGGGGAGRDYCNGTCQPCGCGGSGGSGGGASGIIGQAAYNCNFGYPGTGTNGGAPGTSTAGGSGGSGDGGGPSGTTGSLGIGGNGGTGSFDVSGGGGGGGWQGGGGGGSASSGSGVGGGGGGGGSSYITGLLNGVTTASANLGNGEIIITYTVGMLVNIVASNTSICTGSSAVLSVPGMSVYNWSTGSTAPTITVSPTTSTSYSITGTTTGGCPVLGGLISINVSGGLPTVAIASSTSQVCAGKSVTLTASGAMTYTWTNNITNGVGFTPTTTTTYTVSGENGCGISTAAVTISVAPLPVAAISSPSTVCAGFPSTLTASSAATNYTWAPLNSGSFSMIVSPMSNTIYTVSVSDGTCFGQTTVAINTIPVPTVMATTSSSMVCSGDVVTLSASGANSYTWTPGNLSGATVTVTPLVPTAYSVAGTNTQGCTTGTSVVVLTNPSPNLTLTTSACMICPGGTVSLDALGASSYSWSEGSLTSSIVVNPTLTTIYTVTGTAAGCSSSQTVQIDVFTPNITITSPTAICVGETTTLSASGALSYTWDPGFPMQSITVNPTVTTIYTLTTISASANLNCTSISTLQLLVNPTPTVMASASRTTMCKNEQVTLTASGASTYSWNTGATTAALTITANLVTTMNFTVTGTGSNGCKADATLKVVVNGCVGLAENSGRELELSVFPNPSNGEFTLASQDEIQLTLVNELGQLIKEINLNRSNNFSVKVSGLSKGIYFLNSPSGQKKIIVD